MQSNSRRFVFKASWSAFLCLAAAALWVNVLAGEFKGVQKQHRKTTDPPIQAQGKLGQDLFLAIDHRDLAQVEALIKQGADPNARNGLEFTPLYVAAASHQLDVMKALLAAHAEPDAESPYGTALTFAAMGGHAEGARILLGRGANPNTSRGDGITVLMMAAWSGNPEIVSDLLKHKAKVNEKNDSGASALMYAASLGQVEAGRMLLQAGATIDSADGDGETPLMAAAKSGQAEFVKLLVQKGSKVNARDKKGRTALMLAASYGDYPEVVRTLVEAGAEVNITDAKGRAAGGLAANRGYDQSAAVLGKPTSGALSLKDVRVAVVPSIKLLQASMTEFSQSTGCISCHQEGLGRMATASARNHGFSVDPALNQAQLGRIRGALKALRPLHEQALDNAEAMKQVPLIEINEATTLDGWLLAGMAAQADAPTQATAAMAMVLARQQAPDGYWTFSVPRVPMQSSFVTFTALAVRALNAYGPRSRSAEITERLGKAKAWLTKAPLQSSDDRAFCLLGLKWAGASIAERRKAIEDLRAAQQPDGGWAQMPGMRSDAYASGQALYALRVAGDVSADDAAYSQGIRFLLRTQDDDGSWFVNKRAIPANNYFDAAFPHGESQYASFNGTCWATMALLESMSVNSPRGAAGGIP